VSDFVTLLCPSCGAKRKVSSAQNVYICELCQSEHILKCKEGMFVLSPLTEELALIQQQAIKKEASRAVRKLKADLQNIELELQELSKMGTPLETVRTIGFAVIALGLALSILNGLANMHAMTVAASGIVMGIMLHGSTELFGRDYYIRKDYLKKLRAQKRCELEHYEKLRTR
jgi:uncharacterized protein (UPF0212 family)